MAENVLNAEIRETTGKKTSKQARREGKVPGIFYAHGEKSIPIVRDEREIISLLISEAGLIDIKMGDRRKRKAIIKDIQKDPMKDTLIHVDILGVKLTEKISVTIPVRITGDAVGVREQGGVLHQYLRDIEVSCLPTDIPDYLEIDVTELNIGDSISLETISIENVEITSDKDQPVVSVLKPTVVKEPEPVEEGLIEEGEEVTTAEEEKEPEKSEEKKKEEK